MTGIVALYIFMLAAFTGYEVICASAGDPAHAADVGLQLRARHRAGGRHGGTGRGDTPLEKTIGFIGVLLAAGNAVGGYAVTERMLEMFKASGAARAAKRQGEPLMPDYLSAAALIQASYLVTAFLFIMGLKRMSSPVTARSGILWAGAGMLVATLGDVLLPRHVQLSADHHRRRNRRGNRLDQRPTRRHDRHAADDRALQRHGRRRGRSHCRGGAVSRRRDVTSPSRRSRWSAPSSARSPSAAA